MPRLSLLAGLTALGLLAAGGLTPASAGQSAKTPVHQRALSTSVSIGGNASAAALNNNLALNESRKAGGRLTVQTAVGAAVSVGGERASALAANSGTGAPNGLVLGGNSDSSRGGPSLLPFGGQSGTRSAVATAIRVDGLPIPVAPNDR